MEFAHFFRILEGNEKKAKILIVETKNIGYRGRFVRAVTDENFFENDAIYLDILGKEVRIPLWQIIFARFEG